MVDPLIDTLRWIWAIAEAILIWLMIQRSLAHVYRWFVAYLCADLFQTVVGIGAHYSTDGYARVWAMTESAVLVCLLGAACEITCKIISCYPRLAGMIKSAFGLLFAVACVLATIWLGLISLGILSWSPAYWAMQGLSFVSTGLCIFLVGLGFWSVVYRIPMAPNLRFHRILLVLYGGAIPLVSLSLIQQYSDHKTVAAAINASLEAASIICIYLWCVKFRESGEVAPQLKEYTQDEILAVDAEYSKRIKEVRDRIKLSTIFSPDDDEDTGD